MLKVPNATIANIVDRKVVNVEPIEYGMMYKRVPHVWVEIDKGPRQGVHNGWKGYLADEKGLAVPGSRFIVKHTSNEKSHGYIRLKSHQVKKNMQVLLSPTGIPKKKGPIPARLIWIQGTKDGTKAKISRGSWDADIDAGSRVTARLGGINGPIEFKILYASQHRTTFIAPVGFDQIRQYKDWKLVP